MYKLKMNKKNSLVYICLVINHYYLQHYKLFNINTLIHVRKIKSCGKFYYPLPSMRKPKILEPFGMNTYFLKIFTKKN